MKCRGCDAHLGLRGFSREPGVPFGRPPLSKTYLRSEEDLADWYVRPAGWYEAHGVDLLAESSATAVDPAGHMVVLGSDRELGYQKLLLATGERNRRRQVPGADLPAPIASVSAIAGQRDRGP
jgi:3-phenylpropionate/trans-cinnamate dioxygenase ferredoxin reductase component